MLFILAILVIGVVALASRKVLGKKFIIQPLVIALAFGFVGLALFELINGPHTECGQNASAGPCDLTGRVFYSWPLAVILASLIWTITLVVTRIRKSK